MTQEKLDELLDELISLEVFTSNLKSRIGGQRGLQNDIGIIQRDLVRFIKMVEDGGGQRKDDYA